MLFLINFLILFGPMILLGVRQIKAYEPATRTGASSSRTSAARPRRRRRSPASSRSGSRARTSSRRAASASAACSSSAPPAPARRCSPRGSRRRSTARSSRSRAPASPRPSSAWTRCIVRFLARKAKKLAAKWGGQCIVFIDEIDAVGMRRQSLGSGFTPDRGRLDPRPPLLRPRRRADAGRRPACSRRRLARQAVRLAPSRPGRPIPPIVGG